MRDDTLSFTTIVEAGLMDNKDNLHNADNISNSSADNVARSRHDSTSKEFVSHEGTGGEQAAGTVGGAAVGAAWGMLAGPIGSIVGGLAGAVGGWWAARSATEQHLFNLDDDAYYRAHHDKRHEKGSGNADQRTSSHAYDDVRPAYQTGHLAGANPDYANHSFDDVEPQLRTAYSGAGQNNWDDVRGYARDAYDRGRSVRDGRAGMPTSQQIDASPGTLGTDPITPGDQERDLRDRSGSIADRSTNAADDFVERVENNRTKY